MLLKNSLLILLVSISHFLLGQTATIKGTVNDENNVPVEFAVISIVNSTKATHSDKNGNFTLQIPSDLEVNIQFRLLGYKEKIITVKLLNLETRSIHLSLETDSRTMQQVEIHSENERREEAGMTKVDPKNSILLPSAFGDFNKLIQMLPGVTSNNELSSTYSVRGGNYDENLIYVNGIEVYRPFLVRSGQQEGLSFVNPNLASEVEFSSGGWQSKYGDKLSSVMNVKYKEPKKFEGSVQAGLLGATMHLGGTDKQNRISVVAGFRNKSSKYILNTLPVKGQYFPSFNDFQSYINIDLTNRKKGFPIKKRTTLGLLGSYAGNRYSVIPQTTDINFGSFTEVLKFTAYFDGTEKMSYDTWQEGIKLSHWVSTKFRTEFYASAMDSREREYIDLETGYSVSEVNADPSGAYDPNQAVVERGIGTFYRYARNSLHAQVFAAENRSYYFRTEKNTIEFGAKYSKEIFDDGLNSYGFIDSLKYLTLSKDSTSAHNFLNTNRLTAYIQSTHRIDTSNTITYGIRLGWWDLNKQFLISPTIQYAYNPLWKKDYVFRVSSGIYRQPPFYRELRNFQGEINPHLKAQSSVHLLGGFDHKFMAWKRPFKLTSELYLKYLWDVVPYDVDNVRLRYYAKNDAIAYAAGIDTRLSGEFIKGSESWFSMSIMQTQEKVDSSIQGWIRRPTDQRVNFNIFFQDNMPKVPAWKVYINLVFGSGLPTGVPNSQYRGVISMPSYRRLDIGTNYVLTFNDKRTTKKFFETIMIGIECLNILGINNTISYLWVSLYDGRNAPVPNTLSTQFWNAKLIANF